MTTLRAIVVATVLGMALQGQPTVLAQMSARGAQLSTAPMMVDQVLRHMPIRACSAPSSRVSEIDGSASETEPLGTGTVQPHRIFQRAAAPDHSSAGSELVMAGMSESWTRR